MGPETAGKQGVIVEGDASGSAQRITAGVHRFTTLS